MINIIERIGTEKRKKHVWDKFYLQMCSLSYLDVQNDNVRIGQKKKHVWNGIKSMCKCLSLSLSWPNDNEWTGMEWNRTDWTKGKMEKLCYKKCR